MKYIKNLYFYYTCLFLLLSPFVFFSFIIYEKTFVWYIDGISQHYPILQYYGALLRNIFMGKGFPMVDFTVGMGFDTITTLHYYVLGDPLSLLSILISPGNALFLYEALIIIRLYLIGISFIIFMKYWRKEGSGVLLGALLYTFCGFTLFGGVRHPFFLNPLIYLPFILIGLEQVLRKKKPYILIISVFISTVSNFYFTYILTVIAVIYVLYRYFMVYHKSSNISISHFFKVLLRTSAYYIVGISMGSFLFLPVIYAFIQCGRLTSSQENSIGYFFYNMKYYGKLFQGVFAPGVTPGYWVELSTTPVAAISFVILFCNKKYIKLRNCFILVCIALFVPAFGYLMNGFSYLTNRWSFLINFLIAIIFTITYPDIFHLKRAEKILLFMGLIGYCILSFLCPSLKTVKLGCVLLLITSIIILVLQLSFFQNKRLIQELALYFLVVITIGINGFLFYSPKSNGYINEFLNKEQVKSMTYNSFIAITKDIKDNSFYRVETYGDTIRNEALILDYKDVSGYFSLMNGTIADYLYNLEVIDQRNAYCFDGFDGRTILGTLASVKYFITTNKTSVPYGYKLIKKQKFKSKPYYLYENLYALPIGYTYNSFITEESYSMLNSLEKQNALLHAAILKHEPNNINVTNAIAKKDIANLEAHLIPNENVSITGNKITAKTPGASIRITFTTVPDSEIYLRLNNFSVVTKAPDINTLRVQRKNKAIKRVNVRSPYNNAYFGQKNYLVNTGISKIVDQSWITITFKEAAVYTFDSIDILSYPLENFEASINSLRHRSLNNVKHYNNTIEGDINLDSDGIMVFSIPYSKGWRAYVDDKKTELYRGNIMYMAIPLEAGFHDIKLIYQTPYLKEGIIVSLLALLVFIAIIIVNQYTNNKKKLK